MEPKTAGRAYRVHVAMLMMAGAAVLGAIVAETIAPLGVAGLFLVGAGAAAWRGRRSVILPRGMRRQLDEMADETKRAELEQASGLMMGVVLMFFGAIAVGLGLYVMLS